ncbi:MAG: SdpI family protein [Clostridium sp.]|uniref:SdpI family protein n=1 Tax=Clostridium sp. TaxID=1506 RepID=UPI003039881B
MKKKVKSREKIFNILMWLPIIVTLLLLPFMPDKMPLHIGLSGQVTSMGSKYTLIILSVIVIIMGLSVKYSIKKEAKKDVEAENATTRNEKSLTINGIAALTLLNVVFFVFIYKGFALASPNNYLPDINSIQIINIMICILLIIMGNILPKTRMNSLIGVRTSWSRANSESWAMSQRIGGRVFIAVGLISLIGSFFIAKSLVIVFTLGCLIAGSVVTVIGSNMAYRKTLRK